MPTPNSNSDLVLIIINSNSERCKKGALGAPLKVDVIEGDGNCLFRSISYDQVHHGFFCMSACGVLQTHLYQSEF